MATLRVSALFVYPVKSTRRVSLQRALLTPEGLSWDRAWVVVDAQGKIITQREQPRLALVSSLHACIDATISVPWV